MGDVVFWMRNKGDVYLRDTSDQDVWVQTTCVLVGPSTGPIRAWHHPYRTEFPILDMHTAYRLSLSPVPQTSSFSTSLFADTRCRFTNLDRAWASSEDGSFLAMLCDMRLHLIQGRPRFSATS
ncbi:hypothetical protein K439DRAFT_369051 [Ramaria rubella]|nr:hypothetical protein K439DRAFT_369051 [Ramaria rubella]